MKYDYDKLKSFSFKTKSMTGEYHEFFIIDENLVKVLTTGVGLMPLPAEYSPAIFRKKIKEFKIEKWKERYEPPPYKFVEDGEQWEIELEFNDGKILKSSGNNTYPNNWEKVYRIVSRFHCEWFFDMDVKRIDIFNFSLIRDNGKYKENITINRNEREFVLDIFDVKQQATAKFSIKDVELIDDLLDEIEKVEIPIETDEKINKKDAHYTLEIVCDGEKFLYEGNYIKSELPRNWKSISRIIEDFIKNQDRLKAFKLMSIHDCLEKDEIIYLSVLFDYSEKSYYYKTTDTTIEIGDYVRVPVGKNNYEEIVFVDNVELFNINEVPLPLDKTKSIIGKVEE